MQREHEEAMRIDFQDLLETRRQAQTELTESERDALTRISSGIDQRWRSGPYAEQWRFLRAAHDEYRDRPDAGRQLLDSITYNRDQGRDGGVTDVEVRSLEQVVGRSHIDGVRSRLGLDRGR
ncbi:hypothetical protein [Nocardia sp. NPDC051750]|uniref:hypothetical protein n=1 Tax=Nocardia sp. NPDC051750 TaxID=3364325 RepID=UPI00378F9F8C